MTIPTPGTQSDSYLLGQIHSMVLSLKEGQTLQNDRFDRLDLRMDRHDDRLRNVEQRSAVMGAASGGAMAIGVALIVEGLKQWVRRGT